MTSTAIHTKPNVLADLIPGSIVRDIALVLGGAGLTGLAAQATLYTPFTPVPFTLQTAAVLFVGAALGSVRGVLSMLSYVTLGLCGVPWFAGNSAGWASPSFGYILGFVAAAAAVGALAKRQADRRVTSSFGLMLAGTTLIYAVGSGWLAVALDLSLVRTLELGVLPFLVGDAVKIAVVALALPTAWKIAGTWR